MKAFRKLVYAHITAWVRNEGVEKGKACARVLGSVSRLSGKGLTSLTVTSPDKVFERTTGCQIPGY